MTPLPQRADIVVIGAGIQGCASAYYLRRAGFSVVLLDKSRVAGQQSSRAWGFVRVQGRDPAEIPLMQAAKAIWPQLAAELGQDVGYRQGGALYLAHDAATFAYRESWLAIARRFDLDTRMIGPDETRALLPGLRDPGLGALYTPSDGHAEPEKAAPAFAAAAARQGVVIGEGIGALAIDCAGGAVTGVETEAGRILAPRVLLAAGVDSWRLLRGIGIALPQSWVRCSVAQTEPLPQFLSAAFIGGGIGLRQRPDGSLTLASSLSGEIDITLDHIRLLPWYWRALRKNAKGLDLKLNRVFLRDLLQRLPGRPESRLPAIGERDPEIAVNHRHLAAAQRKFPDLFPGIGPVRLARHWAGRIDTLPDGIPVIDAPRDPAGLLIATGFCGHGFALGPIVGQVMTELADKGASRHDLKAFRLARFAEGDIQDPVSIW